MSANQRNLDVVICRKWQFNVFVYLLIPSTGEVERHQKTEGSAGRENTDQTAPFFSTVFLNDPLLRKFF